MISNIPAMNETLANGKHTNRILDIYRNTRDLLVNDRIEIFDTVDYYRLVADYLKVYIKGTCDNLSEPSIRYLKSMIKSFNTDNVDENCRYSLYEVFALAIVEIENAINIGRIYRRLKNS